MGKGILAGASGGGTNIPVTSDPADNVQIWIDPNEEDQSVLKYKDPITGDIKFISDPSINLDDISSVKVYESIIGTTWTENEDTGVKSQNVAIDGVLASHTAKVDHVYNGDSSADSYATFVEEENQYLTYITNGYAETYNGGITFYIFGDAPTVSIPIVVEVV